MSMTEMFRTRGNMGARLLEAAKGHFRASREAAEPVADERRLKRLAEHERDKELLTEVERHDVEMLNRVRSALYED
ncbi:hypothetical protein [Salibaculum griseiflavum]|mgnify:CR=1 FL=1|uniref:Uncharacterized protein n=1 Tax=Salibaculum griseiflavum TaxID=1914409 RepID=A0A2V1PAP8_9RHOB|nr:hypothetical protein [Salibaculum griseiflavum]PWG18152.1 hypothetical protein DFK10_02550 [Salibaculum griseiflavum]